MAVLIELLATYAPYIYAACGLIALYQLYRLVQVRADCRQAVFTLERNRAMRQMYGIFTVAMAVLLAMGVTYFASSTLPGLSPVLTTPPSLPARRCRQSFHSRLCRPTRRFSDAVAHAHRDRDTHATARCNDAGRNERHAHTGAAHPHAGRSFCCAACGLR